MLSFCFHTNLRPQMETSFDSDKMILKTILYCFRTFICAEKRQKKGNYILNVYIVRLAEKLSVVLKDKGMKVEI